MKHKIQRRDILFVVLVVFIAIGLFHSFPQIEQFIASSGGGIAMPLQAK